jgi:hypothetical protein
MMAARHITHGGGGSSTSLSSSTGGGLSNAQAVGGDGRVHC